MSALALEDTIALATFVGVVAVGLGVELVRSAMADTPRARIRQRLAESVSQVVPVAVGDDVDDAAVQRKRLAADSAAVQWLMRLKGQVDHMGGGMGMRAIALVAVAAAIAVVVGFNFLGLSLWFGAAAAPLAAAAGGAITYRVVIHRYRTAFLAGFPDALELMVRAVRAGVPVVHAIITAGKELPHPLGREFQMMGDALRLGMDQQEVLDAASNRINIPDFRFFVVCLQLQRETGGPLADTLENLSSIIRMRREVSLKTRALTAQGRASSKIIALVPFGIMGVLKVAGADYLNVLFDTPRGQNILYFALTLIVAGMVIIDRMSKLED